MKMSIGLRASKAYLKTCHKGTVGRPMLFYLHGKGRFVRSTSRIWKVINKRVLAKDRNVPGLKLSM